MGISIFQILVVLAVVAAIVGVSVIRRRAADRTSYPGAWSVFWRGDPTTPAGAGEDEPIGVLERFALLGVLVLVAATVWSVLGRYLFNHVDALAEALIFEMGGIVLGLSVAPAVRRGALHALGAPRRRDGPPGLGALDIGLTSLALGVLAWFLLEKLQASIQLGEESYSTAVPIPMAPIVGAVLASLLVAALAGLRRLLLGEDEP